MRQMCKLKIICLIFERYLVSEILSKGKRNKLIQCFNLCLQSYKSHKFITLKKGNIHFVYKLKITYYTDHFANNTVLNSLM